MTSLVSRLKFCFACAVGRGIFSMRKLIEGNLKPFGFMKVSIFHFTIDSQMNSKPKCQKMYLMFTLFRAMLSCVLTTAGSQVDMF